MLFTLIRIAGYASINEENRSKKIEPADGHLSVFTDQFGTTGKVSLPWVQHHRAVPDIEVGVYVNY